MQLGSKVSTVCGYFRPNYTRASCIGAAGLRVLKVTHQDIVQNPFKPVVSLVLKTPIIYQPLLLINHSGNFLSSSSLTTSELPVKLIKGLVYDLA